MLKVTCSGISPVTFLLVCPKLPEVGVVFLVRSSGLEMLTPFCTLLAFVSVSFPVKGRVLLYELLLLKGASRVPRTSVLDVPNVPSDTVEFSVNSVWLVIAIPSDAFSIFKSVTVFVNVLTEL